MNAAWEQQLKGRRAEAEELAFGEADLRALKQQLALVSSDPAFKRERLEVLYEDVAGAEATYNQQVKNIQGDAEVRVEKARKDYRSKLQLQESRFATRRTEVQCKIDGFDEALNLAKDREEAVLRAHAATAAELASL